MKYVELVVDRPPSVRHPMESFLRETDALDRAELLTWNRRPDGVEYALFYFLGDIERYRSRIDSVESISYYRLTPIDAGSFYSYVEQQTRDSDREFRAAFAERSLVVVPPIIYDASGMAITVVGESDDLQSMLDDLPPNSDTSIDAVGDFNRRHGTLAAALTDRQFEAVTAAVDLGYYAVPREASLEAVATAIGCAPSTASAHLRKAHRAVMTRLIRRPGRS